MIYLAIFLLVLAGFIRTISFGVWNVKDKNIIGGLALFLLAIFSAVSSFLNLLS